MAPRSRANHLRRYRLPATSTVTITMEHSQMLRSAQDWQRQVGLRAFALVTMTMTVMTTCISLTTGRTVFITTRKTVDSRKWQNRPAFLEMAPNGEPVVRLSATITMANL